MIESVKTLKKPGPGMEYSLRESFVSILASSPSTSKRGQGQNQNKAAGQGDGDGDAPFKMVRIPKKIPPSGSPFFSKFANEDENEVKDEASFLNQSVNKFTGLRQMIRPYLGLVYLSIVLSILASLLILTCCWTCLFYDVNYSMSRTFSWEVVTQLLGSDYDDCIDYSAANFPVETAPREHCRYNVTTPWIPVAGALNCILTATVIAYIWIGRLIGREIELRNYFCYIKWVNVLMFLCLMECLHFGYGMATLANNYEKSRNLRRHMGFTMNINSDGMVHDIYFRWDVTQAARKCCGIDGASDWKFGLKNVDPRYPLSCCDSDNLINPSESSECHFFPKRYEVWREGCLEKEMGTVKEYQESFVRLHAFSVMSIILMTLITMLLEKYLATEPLIPRKKINSPKIFKSNQKRKKTPPTPTLVHFNNNYDEGSRGGIKSSIEEPEEGPAEVNNNRRLEIPKRRIDKPSDHICVVDVDCHIVDAVGLGGGIETNTGTETLKETPNIAWKGYRDSWTDIDMKPVFTRKYQLGTNNNNSKKEIIDKEPKAPEPDIEVKAVTRKETWV